MSAAHPEQESMDFIKEMFDKIALDLTEDQKRQVEELLQENKEVFSTSEFDLGSNESGPSHDRHWN